MIFFDIGKKKASVQYLISIMTVLVIAAVCFPFRFFFNYRVVALVLLMAVSILAILFDIIPVLMAALLSALIWNFFFIAPIFTFHIHNGEDLLLFFSYFFVSLINAALTFKIRKAEQKVQEKEEKENTIKLYNTLLNSLSHELRTPIATILGAVDTLKDDGIKLSESQQNELLNEIDIASIRLNKQVGNLLNMSRIETGLFTLHKEWCDVNELIEIIMQKFASAAKGKKILFDPDERLPLCKIDIGIMEQAIQNIVSNAIQYTPVSAKIAIAVTVWENELNISILDDGIGIQHELLDKIFNKFYRVPNTKVGGTGLGLSIAKGFVEVHDGTVIVENILPHGLRFDIKVPVETSYINNLKNE
ncbi:MAG TPA: ATP-binding protein [Arachidicoccus sp.]